MRRSVSLVLALVLAASVATSQRNPSSFWKEAIKEPLSKADADLVFMEHYKDAVIPPPQGPFLEGTADAGILFDGRVWTLAGEPERGTTVRFVGVPGPSSSTPSS